MAIPEGVEAGGVQPFSAANNASETLQASQQLTNDTPIDVNPNAVVARSQVLTVDTLGKGFVAAQERRQILADQAIKGP